MNLIDIFTGGKPIQTSDTVSVTVDSSVYWIIGISFLAILILILLVFVLKRYM